MRTKFSRTPSVGPGARRKSTAPTEGKLGGLVKATNCTVKNSVPLIAASYTHILFVSTLTGALSRPLRLHKRSIHHSWVVACVVVEVIAECHGASAG
ncbi:hypothetical protein OG21DRAFT_543939 [Imleria badia]|nr:hypothetical protein OG21DRAFT_543939 [Imleria badia]